MQRDLLFVLFSACIIALVSNAYSASGSMSINYERPSNSGAITGRVLDAQGRGVFEARISAERTDFTTGKLPTTKSDIQGNFQFRDLKVGTYTLYVAKEEDGYAPTDSVFHYGGSMDAPQVTVYEQQASPEVVIHLGSKASRLTGHIVDGATNKPVVWDAQITLSRVDNPGYMYSTGPNLKGEFNVLVPSVPFTMKVSAPGYEDWYYRNESSKQRFDALELGADTAKEVVVSLRPSK
jgi:hypothetical protein